MASRLGGWVYSATLAEIDVPAGTLPRHLVHAAIIGSVTLTPAGAVVRVVDVQSPERVLLPVGAPLSLLVEEIGQ